MSLNDSTDKYMYASGNPYNAFDVVYIMSNTMFGLWLINLQWIHDNQLSTILSNGDAETDQKGEAKRKWYLKMSCIASIVYFSQSRLSLLFRGLRTI